MRSFLFKHPIVRKLAFSAGIIFLFLLGRNIPLPTVDTSALSESTSSSLTVATALTGGNLARIGLFSLGLGPWMYASILSRVFSLGQQQKSEVGFLQEKNKLFIMLIVGVIQGLSLALSITYQDGLALNHVSLMMITTLLLLVGSFILMWLGNLNATYGIGGPTLIMFVSIVASQFSLFPVLIEELSGPRSSYIWFILVWTLFSMYVTVLLDKAEYRIPIQRISIHNELDNSYLPIRVNPSNGMAIMYAFTFLALPQYLLIFLSFLFKDTSLLAYGSYFTTNTLIGILIYTILVLMLSYSFAFVNVDPLVISKTFRASGDYIEGVRPGKPTKDYLSSYIRFFGIFSGLMMSMLLSAPLFLVLREPELQSLTPLTGIFMMIVGMVVMIREELGISRLKKQYRPLFEIKQ
ncbi:accessory Sec system protein translocase subunit SecY2 [Streptococcus pneumoniae]